MNAQILLLCLLSSLQLLPQAQSQCSQALPAPRLTLKSPLSRGVLLFWSAPARGACYLIRYQSTNLFPVHSGSSGPYTVTMATVLGLEENTQYRVSICAARSCSCAADQYSCSTHVVGTPAAKPSGPAGSLTATQVGEDRISVSWTEPEARHQNGRINGYKACIEAMGMPQKCEELSGSTKSYTFTCLQPFTEYKVTVPAKNSNGFGEGGRGLSVTTQEGAPSPPGLEGVVTQKDTTNILVSPPTQPNGEVKQYEVMVARHQGGGGKACCSMPRGRGRAALGKYRATSHLIAVSHTTLEVGSDYCFWVRAINSKHTGRWSGSVVNGNNSPASSGCPGSSSGPASGESTCVKPVTVQPIMGNRTITPETPTEATACIDIHPPQLPAVLQEISVFYTPCKYDPKNPESERSATFSASLTCQRLIGLKAGICYRFAFSVKVVIRDLSLPTARSKSLTVDLPSLDSNFRLPPRGHLDPTSTCTLYGFHHVTTFDGQPYAVAKMGRYKVVKDRRSFSLLADLQPCEGSRMTCLDNLRYTDDSCGLRVDMSASDCGGSISIMYGSCATRDVLSWIEGCRRHVYLARSRLTVVWDGRSYLQITTGVASRDTELCGLCGDYNGVRRGELELPSALLPASRQSECLRLKNREPRLQCLMGTFAQRWRVEDSAPGGRDPPAKCSWSVSPAATQTCAVLVDSSGEFSRCFPVVNFATFHRQCVHDTCGEEAGVRQARFCSVAAEYVGRCAQAGVSLSLPQECRPQQSLDCVLEEQAIPGFDFGSINDASPHYCSTRLRQRRCMPTGNNPASVTCKPSRSGILEVDYTCSLIGKDRKNIAGTSSSSSSLDGGSKDKVFQTTLKVPEDFSCDIYS